MKITKIRFLIFSNILIALFVGIVMCLFIYPFYTSLYSIGNYNLFNIENASNKIAIAQLIFYWTCSIPCFVLLLIFFIITIKYNENNIDYKLIKILKICSIVLLVDLILYLIGNIVTISLNIDSIALIYIFIDLIGFAFEFFLIYIIKLLEEVIERKVNNDILLNN